LTSAIALSISSTWWSESTGPKISVRATSLANGNPLEHRRPYEVASWILQQLGTASVNNSSGAVDDGASDEGFDVHDTRA